MLIDDSWADGSHARVSVELLSGYMSECRSLVLEEMRRIVPTNSPYGAILYDLVFEYPLREAKALRPALCIATCRALGGTLDGVTTSAMVLELYHNAFLIHDDIEDGSERRRDGPTLHREHGVPIAVNVGDAMLALALEPLLDNMRLLSLGKALRILRVIARMAKESAEGQAVELSWTRNARWQLSDRDYFRLVHKKTSHYTFLAPIAIGTIVAGSSPELSARLQLFATALGIAFQIQDDVLNLAGSEERIGKEVHGDLWEGKHTLILLHALRSASDAERRQAARILSRARPFERDDLAPDGVEALVNRLARDGDVSARAQRELLAALRDAPSPRGVKTAEDVGFLKHLIERKKSIEYASAMARRWAARARKSLAAVPSVPASVHRDFLFALTDFVTERDH